MLQVLTTPSRAVGFHSIYVPRKFVDHRFSWISTCFNPLTRDFFEGFTCFNRGKLHGFSPSMVGLPWRKVQDGLFGTPYGIYTGSNAFETELGVQPPVGGIFFNGGCLVLFGGSMMGCFMKISSCCFFGSKNKPSILVVSWHGQQLIRIVVPSGNSLLLAIYRDLPIN